MAVSSETLARTLLDRAGIPINVAEPFSLHVHNPQFWDRVIADRQLGLGESYMDGWWDCAAIDQLLTKLLEINVLKSFRPSLTEVFHVLKSNVRNRQTKSRAKVNAQHHYNIGNDLYSRMLDPEMAYSCGYWAKADNLNDAQIAKFDLICRKLHLAPGMRVLDIGCGWGGFLRHAVKNYGVVGVGISPAENQIELAKSKSEGLGIDFRVSDYRDLTGQFDRIVSIGMMEHVGPRNYRTFFGKCDELLAPDGLMLHHTISSNYSKNSTDPFFDRYIFPGGVLPSLAQIAKATEGRFIIEDVQNFGPDYYKTLLAWHANINAKWAEIPNYDERFRRMWNYYLLSSAAGFRSGNINLIQNVFGRIQVRESYIAAR